MCDVAFDLLRQPLDVLHISSHLDMFVAQILSFEVPLKTLTIFDYEQTRETVKVYMSFCIAPRLLQAIIAFQELVFFGSAATA